MYLLIVDTETPRSSAANSMFSHHADNPHPDLFIDVVGAFCCRYFATFPVPFNRVPLRSLFLVHFFSPKKSSCMQGVMNFTPSCIQLLAIRARGNDALCRFHRDGAGTSGWSGRRWCWPSFRSICRCIPGLHRLHRARVCLCRLRPDDGSMWCWSMIGRSNKRSHSICSRTSP